MTQALQQAPAEQEPADPPSAAALPPRHPHIRSFSGRRGHFTSGQRLAYETLRERWCIAYDAQRTLDATALRAIYGREAPLVVEIGFGMGDATARIAAAEPHNDFLGIEVYPAGVGALLMRIEAQGLRNLRIVQHDAVEVLRDMIAPDSLARVQVFFPDPWPKKRHHKRRLIQPPFVALLAARLRPGGRLHCATDWEPYAAQMLDVLSREPLLENTVRAGASEPANEAPAASAPYATRGEAGPRQAAGEAPAGGYAARPDDRPPTRFESRGRRLGHEIRDLVFRRRR